MSFVAWPYPFFLIGVVILYWVLGRRPRQLLLLVASYIFYGFWDVRFLALVMTTTGVDYLAALGLAGHRPRFLAVLGLPLLPGLWLGVCKVLEPLTGPVPWGTVAVALALGLAFSGAYQGLWLLPENPRRRGFLFLSVGSCLAILGFFKYFGFFTQQAVAVLRNLGFEPGWVLPHIVLPVGISFYTFQSLGYVFDVYRGRTEVCRDFLTFAVFDAYFPQLVAGPIERAGHLIPQLDREQVFHPAHLQEGLKMILVGLFKKVFVADNCALLANYAFAPETTLNGYWAVLGALAFAFQIYGDFSGYSDIARGSSRLLGIELVQNFRFPYLARNPSDFWRRWHISLSAWFRDYVYIPLGGNRGSRSETMRNLALTLLLAGFWHGASWIFILWGAYWGAFLIFYHFSPVKVFADREATWSWHTFGSVLSMWIITLMGWAIFRSPDLARLGSWLAALGNWDSGAALPWARCALWLGLHLAPLWLLKLATCKAQDETALEHLPWPVRGVIYALLLLLVVSSTEHDQEFIYFQF
jgi:D-alanyl-lipoteichoic acid acyltransferase DltB (MBOAT superfamily)